MARNILRQAGLCAILLAFTGSAHASLITIQQTDFSGGASVATFTVGSTQGLPYSESGATFASYSGFFSSVLSFNNFLALGGSGTLVVTFSNPMSQAGFLATNADFSSSLDMSVQAFSDVQGVNSVGQISLGSLNPLASGFAGFRSDALFSRADITFTVPGPTNSFVVDDFRFQNASVPEPQTFALVFLGFSVFAGSQLRRRRTQE